MINRSIISKALFVLGLLTFSVTDCPAQFTADPGFVLSERYLPISYGTYDPLFVQSIKAVYQELILLQEENKHLRERLDKLEDILSAKKVQMLNE